MLKQLITAGLVAGAALGLAPAANAAPDVEPLADGSNCQVIPWGFLGSQRRAICDTPAQADGSWWRRRVVATPAHYVPMTTNCFGTSFVTCTTYGGYNVPFSTQADETYPVNNGDVLPDEPGHMGPGAPRAAAPAPAPSTDGIRHDTIA